MSSRTGRLSRKLRTTFTALGLLGLLVVAVTSYTVLQWRETEQDLSRHYVRSLRLQEVRALTFEAYKEVPDAVIGSDPDARQDYVRRLQPISRAFDEWASLAEDDAERAEVDQVRAAAGRLDRTATRVFDLVDGGRRDRAAAQLESAEETAFEPFDRLTEGAVASDRRKRAVIQSAAADARRTATITLAVAALGVISLLLLVAAYLSGGVFGPVRRLKDAMQSLNRGDREVRVGEDGDDEMAGLAREFNLLAAQVDRARAGPDANQELADARALLHRQLTGLRNDLSALARGDRSSADALLARVDAAITSVNRLGELAYPVDLRLAPVPPAVLLHDVLDRFTEEIVRRSVSTQVEVDPTVDSLVVDRGRIRETLSELVRNALDALPERGGSLRLRTRRAGPEIAVEVQDDGSGIAAEDIAWLYDGSRHEPGTRGVGLRLATSVVEQHDGRLQLETLSPGGTTARILLPDRTRSKGHHR